MYGIVWSCKFVDLWLVVSDSGVSSTGFIRLFVSLLPQPVLYQCKCTRMLVWITPPSVVFLEWIPILMTLWMFTPESISHSPSGKHCGDTCHQKLLYMCIVHHPYINGTPTTCNCSGQSKCNERVRYSYIMASGVHLWCTPLAMM